MSLTVTNTNETEFLKKTQDEIAKLEEYKQYIYADNTGVPTIGYGFAQFIIYDSSEKKYKLSDLKDINSELGKIKKSISEAEYKLLGECLEELNSTKTSEEKESEVDEILAKTDDSGSKIFQLEFTPDEAKTLMNDKIESTIATLKSKLGSTTYEKIKYSDEFTALVSQGYGGVYGDKCIQAVKDGNRLRAWFEIRYCSNSGNSECQGMANRRYRESDLFGLYNGTTPTLDEAKQLFSFFRNADPHKPNIYDNILDRITTYEDEYDAVNSNASSSKASDTFESARKLMVDTYITDPNYDKEQITFDQIFVGDSDSDNTELNGDGVETTSLENGAYFDHDDNNFAEQTAWVNRIYNC